ncbi:MAG: redoxin domain-containing protein [Lachnospiraceae bacterium]
MENNINRMPLIGDIAPSFKAVTTQGNINFPEDYKGKWVILFSHPADFTPVCTTEFMTFASMAEEFKAMNTELVGLSVDSLYAHIAWLRKIQELSWNGKEHVEVKFPLIEDIRMEVANKYGMIQPGREQHAGGARRLRHRPGVEDPPHPLLPAEHRAQL